MEMIPKIDRGVVDRVHSRRADGAYIFGGGSCDVIQRCLGCFALDCFSSIAREGEKEMVRYIDIQYSRFLQSK